MDKDIHGGKFMKNSRSDIVQQLEAQTTSDIINAGISGATNFGTMSAGMDIFKGGVSAAAKGTADEAGKGLLGSLAGGVGALGDAMKTSAFKKLGLDATKDVGKNIPGSVMSSIKQSGKNLFKAADFRT